MGYMTDYTLEIDTREADALAAIHATLLGYEDADCAFDLECGEPSDTYEPSGAEVKWYEHEADMREVSKKHPGVLFTLFGEGEDSGDVWKKYFRDGLAQVEQAKLVIAPFDPEKLQ